VTLTLPWAAGDDRKRAKLLRMKVIATALLPVMALVFVLAAHFKTDLPALAWVEAFAEAAMIGGLADWFAVVALFRHPGGLPLPHTAIIPNNKDRIGAQLGDFVEQNFLTPENITTRLAEFEPATAVVTWLADAEHARGVISAVRDELPRFVTAVDEPEIERAIARVVRSEIERIDLARLAGRVLAILTREGRHQRLLDELLPIAARWLNRYRSEMKLRFGRRSLLTPPWMDSFIVDRFVDGIIDLIDEVARTPKHDMRVAFDGAVRRFIGTLKSDPEIAQRIDEVRASLLRGRAIDTTVSAAWSAIRARLAAASPSDERESDAWLARIVANVAAEILADRPLLDRLNHNVLGAIQAGLGRFQHQFAGLIEDIVKRWDTQQVTEKVELELGPDLQFIRLNGTVIGGLAGVALHAVQLLAGVAY
jgi:uncharacterized membrane-anchored protein YjiN (DUF445 family)